MIRIATTLLFSLLIACAKTKAQTLVIKCNSAEYLHLVAVGDDASGHKTVRGFTEVTQGFRKTMSLFKEKYGYDNYNNSSMIHEPDDSTSRWTELRIYDKSNTRFATLDLTKAAKHVTIEQTDLELSVRQETERGYLITTVIISDIQ